MKEFIKQTIIRELAFCASYLYKKFRPFVIAVTGSTGKTTTKYMIGELLLRTTGDILVSQENLNSQYGLPLAMLGYKASPKNPFGWAWVFISSPIKALVKLKYPKYLVLEYASDRPGDMRHLIGLVPPDIAVITNIGVAHLVAFKTVEAIAKEKWELALAASSKVITTKQVIDKTADLPPTKADIVVVDNPKTVKAKNIKNYKNKTEFDLEICGRTSRDLEISLVGPHIVENLTLAMMAAISATGESKKMISALEVLAPMEGRGKRFITQEDIMVIDESYNANPVSMVAALSNLKQIGFGRKVAILGEMKEIGDISEKAHEEVAKIARTVADITVGVGEDFKNSNLDRWYLTVEQLIRDLDSVLKSNDTVLIKGSHSVSLEKAVQKLEENKK